MDSVPRIYSSVTDSFSIKQCVVLPYGPKWFAARVEGVISHSNKVEVLYLDLSDQHETFIESDEPQCCEFLDSQLFTRIHYIFS